MKQKSDLTYRTGHKQSCVSAATLEGLEHTRAAGNFYFHIKFFQPNFPPVCIGVINLKLIRLVYSMNRKSCPTFALLMLIVLFVMKHLCGLSTESSTHDCVKVMIHLTYLFDNEI